MLACKSGDEKKCNPNPKNMSELIVFNTNEELEKYSKELEKYGLRKEYRLDSQERIDKNYKNASPLGKQAIDYENVKNLKLSTGKTETELYSERKISKIQYDNYKKELKRISQVQETGNFVNNVVSPIVNSVSLGIGYGKNDKIKNNMEIEKNFETRNRIMGNKNNQYNQPKNPKYQSLRNEDTIINGRLYSGHALDRMQDRGIPISVVEETIMYGKKTSTYSKRIQYYDSKNNITVVTEKNDKVVMTRHGK